MTPQDDTRRQPDADELIERGKPAGEIRRMFDAISPTYDLLNHLLSLDADRWWRRRTAHALITRDTRNVLDVCSGTGDLALAFAARARALGAGTEIVSVDFTPSMVRLALRKSGATGRKGLSAPACAVADTLRLPFPDGAFDLVAVAFGIRNVSDTLAGLREMARVCRSGGKVAVLEFSRPGNAAMRMVYSLYSRHVLPSIGRVVSGSSAYGYLTKSVETFPEGENFARLLSEVTGSGTERTALSWGIATLYVSTRR